MVEEPQLRRMPTACLVKPGVAWADFLGPTWDSPTGASVFNLQPPTGRLSPSGTRLGTRMPVEDSNCIRIAQLEGSRPRILSPVLLPKNED
jgi:hypothetical protein